MTHDARLIEATEMRLWVVEPEKRDALCEGCVGCLPPAAARESDPQPLAFGLPEIPVIEWDEGFDAYRQDLLDTLERQMQDEAAKIAENQARRDAARKAASQKRAKRP